MTVGGVVTQGRSQGVLQWVTSYTVSYSTDGTSFASVNNAADASTYRRANSCTQPVSDKPAHSSAYNS